MKADQPSKVKGVSPALLCAVKKSVISKMLDRDHQIMVFKGLELLAFHPSFTWESGMEKNSVNCLGENKSGLDLDSRGSFDVPWCRNRTHKRVKNSGVQWLAYSMCPFQLEQECQKAKLLLTQRILSNQALFTWGCPVTPNYSLIFHKAAPFYIALTVIWRWTLNPSIGTLKNSLI